MAYWRSPSCATGISILSVAHPHNASGVLASARLDVTAVVGLLQVPTGIVNGEPVLAGWCLQSSSSAHVAEPSVLHPHPQCLPEGPKIEQQHFRLSD